MYSNDSGALPTTTTRPADCGTVDSPDFSLQWHRTQIHTRPQHGCVLCPPVPCVCGYNGECCPDEFEHRRGYAAAETTWREQAVA